MLIWLCALLLLGSTVLALGSASVNAAGLGHAAKLFDTTGTPSDTPTNTPSNTPTNTPSSTPTATATSTASTPTATATTAPTATPNPNPYDLGPQTTTAIHHARWPQQYGNWCGIATIAAIAAYLNPGTGETQSGIASALNSAAAESEWGYPTPHIGGAVYANISEDYGTDPRAIAEGLTLATGIQYNPVVDTGSAFDATTHIVDDMLNAGQPISVIVDHGQHSVLVAGVKTKNNADPRSNPGSITAIHVFDPGGGVDYVGIQPAIDEWVSLSTWLSGIIAYSGSDYFKYPYAANVYQGTPLDPDPSVGPYTYVPKEYNHLWIGHYVWAAPYLSGLNADWEFNQNGALIAGRDTSGAKILPDGYTGASVAMPNNAPPPPPPVQVFKTAPLPSAPPPPRPTPTATPKPTATPQPTFTPMPTATLFATPAPVATASACGASACLMGGMTPAVPITIAILALLGSLALVWRLQVHTAKNQPITELDRPVLVDMLPDRWIGARVVPVLTPVDAPPSKPFQPEDAAAPSNVSGIMPARGTDEAPLDTPEA